MTAKHYQDKTLPPLLESFASFLSDHAQRLEELSKSLLAQRSDEHCIPAQFISALPLHP